MRSAPWNSLLAWNRQPHLYKVACPECPSFTPGLGGKGTGTGAPLKGSRGKGWWRGLGSPGQELDSRLRILQAQRWEGTFHICPSLSLGPQTRVIHPFPWHCHTPWVSSALSLSLSLSPPLSLNLPCQSDLLSNPTWAMFRQACAPEAFSVRWDNKCTSSGH